jgi:oligopeptide transport system permease protein
MAENKNNFENNEPSNAVMANASNAIMAEDFVRSNADIEKNLKFKEKVKTFGKMLGAN